MLQNNSAKKSNFWLLKYTNFIGLRSVDNEDLYGVIESLYYIIHEIVSTWIVRIDYGFTTGK